MIKIYTTLFVFMSIIHFVNAQTILIEDFDYPVVDSLEHFPTWIKTGINSNYNIKTKAPGLIYTGYSGSNKGIGSELTNSGEGDVLFKNFDSSINKGVVYMSFMFRVDSLPATVSSGFCIGFNPKGPSTYINTKLSVKRINSSSFQLGVGKEGVSYGSDNYNTNTTYLIVLKYSFVDGSNNDSCKLYVFSQGVPSSEPNSALCFTTIGADVNNQGKVYLLNNYAQGNSLNGINIKIDGIRVGTSWESSVLSKLSSVSNPIFSQPSISILTYPNPFRVNTKITYQLSESANVRIDILNISGVSIEKLIDSNQSSGTHIFEWMPNELDAGIYLIRFMKDGEQYIQKVIKY